MSGYVTKTERSSMQEIWQEVSDNKSIYSRLWISGNPVFEKVSTKLLLLQLGCATSINIWNDSVVYDELTINERQKTDKEFSSMLDCVRRGCPTDETLCTLKQKS